MVSPVMTASAYPQSSWNFRSCGFSESRTLASPRAPACATVGNRSSANSNPVFRIETSLVLATVLAHPQREEVWPAGTRQVLGQMKPETVASIREEMGFNTRLGAE